MLKPEEVGKGWTQRDGVCAPATRKSDSAGSLIQQLCELMQAEQHARPASAAYSSLRGQSFSPAALDAAVRCRLAGSARTSKSQSFWSVFEALRSKSYRLQHSTLQSWSVRRFGKSGKTESGMETPVPQTRVSSDSMSNCCTVSYLEA